VDPALRLAVELPPVPLRGDTTSALLDPWWEMARAAVAAGAGTVWLTGGSGAEVPPGADPACDPCTMAGAAATQVGSCLVGVVSGLPADRHPAVLARDVTTLDVVSGGRAAVLLRWTGSGAAHEGAADLPAGLPEACEYLGEALAVCRSVLQDDDPVFEGRYLHVAGALNRPPPRRPGGPPLLVEVPAGVAGLARREAGPGLLLRQASSAASAIVCPDDPGEIASWRDLVADATAALWTGVYPEQIPPVVCRTTLRHAWTEPTTRARTGAVARSRLDAARAAGADGVIVRMPSGRRGDESLRFEADDAERMGRDLADCFEPWRR